MRLWHFDRSGSLGSCPFDINQEGFRFIYVMLGYLLMNDKQLGYDPTTQLPTNGQRYIDITREGRKERLDFIKEIKKKVAVAGRATFCWIALSDNRSGNSITSLVVKDSWQCEERLEEGELIKKATNKGVQNIAKYYHHETVRIDDEDDDISGNVRKGMMKEYGRTAFAQKSALAQQIRDRHSLQTGWSSSIAIASLSPKSSGSSPQSTDPKTSFYNRVHRRVITQTPGKPIYKASSRVAMINGFLGALSGKYISIRGYSILLTCSGLESLWKVGILHHDVSIGNIMLTEQEDTGFLIGFDHAIETNGIQASSGPPMIGTKVFMAIGELLGDPHTIGHEYESIFLGNSLGL